MTFIGRSYPRRASSHKRKLRRSRKSHSFASPSATLFRLQRTGFVGIELGHQIPLNVGAQQRHDVAVSSAAPISSSTRLRLRVTATAESCVRQGHPWVYSDSVRERSRDGVVGDLAVIYDRNDRFLAIGLFDPLSPIRVRILHTGKPLSIDAAFWKVKIDQAKERRAAMFDVSTTGYRWIHGESDGLPALVLDRYDGTLVLKVYSAAWLPHLPQLIPQVIQAFGPERLVLRTSRNIREQADPAGFTDGRVLYGPKVDGPVVFLESGIRFEADVLKGQKTGFFLDQRENRRWVGSAAAGAHVLNAFSFSGGFSLYAARGGATSVTDLDISAHALESARRNFQLNQDLPTVRAAQYEGVQTDAFEWLAERRTPRFDLVILDPPSLAKRESERSGAIQAYRRLVRSGSQQLKSGGTLVAASCSAHVSAEEFYQAALQGVADLRRPATEVRRAEHPDDHPAGFVEARYLKCLVLRLGPAVAE